MKLAKFFTAMLFAGLLLGACTRPKPPTLMPEKGEVTSIGPDGIHVTVHLAVENPNRFDLSVRSVTGRALLEGKYDLGSMALPQPLQLPSGKVTRLSVPIILALRDLPAVVGLAVANRNLTYDVNGSVNVGGESLNVDLPFRLTGEITHEQLLKATVNSLPHFP